MGDPGPRTEGQGNGTGLVPLSGYGKGGWPGEMGFGFSRGQRQKSRPTDGLYAYGAERSEAVGGAVGLL